MAEFKQDLKGKVALVTGSSRGIGAAIALRLAAHGADVVINYVHSVSGAEQVAQRARTEHGVRAITVQADVAEHDEIAHMFAAAKSQLGRIDVVMSNSGIEHFGDLDKVTGDEIDRVFAVNVRAQYFVAQQAYKYMEDGGRLILMSSISSVLPVGRHAVYAASKAAITGMVKCLAVDFAPKNITVNCIAPGGIKSDMYADAARKYIPGGAGLTDEEVDAKACEWSVFKRVGMPEDVAGVVALIASPESTWLTGQTFHPSGGAHMATA